MVHIAVLGSNEFVVGFQLAGIKTVMQVTNDPKQDLQTLRDDANIGIIVVEESVLDQLDQDDREEIEDSVEPVVIPVSKKAEQDSLRRLIKKSIGVDLWS